MACDARIGFLYPYFELFAYFRRGYGGDTITVRFHRSRGKPVARALASQDEPDVADQTHHKIASSPNHVLQSHVTTRSQVPLQGWRIAVSSWEPAELSLSLPYVAKGSLNSEANGVLTLLQPADIAQTYC
jgi:hypothetical protein